MKNYIFLIFLGGCILTSCGSFDTLSPNPFARCYDGSLSFEEDVSIACKNSGGIKHKF